MSETTQDRVSDAPADIWVYRLLPRWLWPYAQLARWDRPIGWWLLLWPCWWSVMLAYLATLGVVPTPQSSLQAPNLFLFGYDFVGNEGLLVTLPAFLIGAMMMRGAGCTYNDLVDTKLDSQVERTKSRPIPSGRVSKNAAVRFAIGQAFIGLLALIWLCQLYWFRDGFNWFASYLAIASLLIVAAYPFAKRITDWPQLVLGLSFSWGALMGWAVVFRELSAAPILLYIGSVLWVIGYDTIYAHQDREDDALVGVRSTARLFGERTKPALILLYSGTLVVFVAAFYAANTGWPAYLGLIIGCGHMIWQIRALDIEDADNCLALFKSNKIFGWIIFAGLVVDIFI